MKNRIPRRASALPRYLAYLFAACATVGTGSSASFAQAPQKSVLTLYAAGPYSPGAALMDSALHRILSEGLGGRLDYYREYLDVARFPGRSHLDAVETFLQVKYGGRRFDLILATSDAALDFVTRYRDVLSYGTPVVFAKSTPIDGLPNGTGLIARVNFRDTLASAVQIQPDIQRVVVVSGASEFDKFYEAVARDQFKTFEGRLAFTYLSGLPLKEVLRQVAILPARSIVFLANLAEDGAGERFLPAEIFERLSAAASVPTYTWLTTGMGKGIVGGRLLSPEVLARPMADLGLRVLGGERPETIPVVEVDWSVTEFDWRQLERWGINESRLPTGSTLLFRRRGAWEQHGPYIAGSAVIAAIQAGFIVTLLLQRSRRARAERAHREAEEALRKSQERYTMAAAAGSVGVWDWHLATNEIFVDPEIHQLLGFETGEIPDQLADWQSLVHPEDVTPTLARAQACIDGDTDVYQIEHRMLHRDGTVRWFLSRGSLFRGVDGTPSRLIGTAIDITARKRAERAIRENEAALEHSHREVRDLAGRLIEAQEAERARIARDLHDDVSQQLAGLAIALSGFRRRVAVPGDDRLLEDVASLQQRTIALADNVRHLSHELHPDVLQHTGLPAALSSYCAELQQHHAIELTCRAEWDVESLDPGIALCLYRVAQEALRNVVTHADARRAEIRLEDTGAAAELTITDDGKGFDITKARLKRNTLGLVSINERVRLAGGTVTIVTELAKGTKMHVRIPLNREATNAGTSGQRLASA
jgi:PAS domain S-box-containing protein